MIAAYLIILAAWCYVALRAWLLPIYHDEAVSLIYIVIPAKSVWDIVTYKAATINNHLLNSLAMMVMHRIGGFHEFVLRIPALLAFGFYSFGILAILKRFLTRVPLILGLLFCLAHPFVLSHFSIARGYPLALAFMIWGIFYLLRFLDQANSSTLRENAIVFSFALLALAVLSNLAFVNIFLGSALVIFVGLICGAVKNGKTVKTFSIDLWGHFLFPFLVFAGLLAAIYVKPIIKLNQKEQFYFGGQEGFWQDTVGSLIERCFFNITDFSNPSLQGLVVGGLFVVALILALGFTLILFQIFRQKRLSSGGTAALTLLATMCVAALSNVLQHWMFGVKYIMGRAAIFYIPLFLLFVLAVGKMLAECFPKVKNGSHFIFSAGLISVIVFFLSAVNLSHHYRNNGADVRAFMRHVIALRHKGILTEPQIQIRARQHDQPMFNFYVLKYDLGWVSFLKSPYLVQSDARRYHVFQLFQEDISLITKHRLALLKYFPMTNSYLGIPRDMFLRKRMSEVMETHWEQ